MRPTWNPYTLRCRVLNVIDGEPAPGGASVEKQEMGITHGDFFRVFPRLVAPAPVSREGLRVTVSWEAPRRSLQVILSEEKNRKIAGLSIPYTELEFRFCNFSTSERQAFFTRFHRAFQKGGGLNGAHP